MGIFNRRKTEEVRELGEDIFDATLRACLKGTNVTAETAMGVPTVYSAVSFISGVIAGLPIRMYRTEDKTSTEVRDDYRLALLNREPGDLLDAFQWKSAVIRDYLLTGGGYTFVSWRGNRITGLYYLDPRCVSAEVNADPIYKKATIRINGKAYRSYQVMRVLRGTLDGVTGRGLVQEVPTQLETMINALKYENNMVRTGSKKGFLKSKNRLTQAVIDQLKASWKNLYSSSSEETVVVLNDGLEFQDASQTAVDAQLNENKTNNGRDVYKILGIVPAVIEGSGSAEDLKNTVRFGLIPVIRALETAINRFCLLETEKETLRFEMDTDALDGTDILARYQAYETAVRNGWMQPDEIRYEEGMNPLGLDFVRLGLDTVIYDPETKTIYTPNTKEWTDLDGKGVNSSESGNQV